MPELDIPSVIAGAAVIAVPWMIIDLIVAVAKRVEIRNGRLRYRWWREGTTVFHPMHGALYVLCTGNAPGTGTPQVLAAPLRKGAKGVHVVAVAELFRTYEALSAAVRSDDS